MRDHQDFSALATELQRFFALSELPFTEPSSTTANSAALVILRLRNLKLKMYQEKGHKLPHIHVDYGKTYHAATFSIDPARRIEGRMDENYVYTVEDWIDKNKDVLMAIWSNLQAGGDAHDIVAELAGYEA